MKYKALHTFLQKTKNRALIILSPLLTFGIMSVYCRPGSGYFCELDSHTHVAYLFGVFMWLAVEIILINWSDSKADELHWQDRLEQAKREFVQKLEEAKELPHVYEDTSATKGMRHTAEKLWGLLDDIDTLSDVCKPTENDPKAAMAFYKNAMKYAEDRHKYLKSDGYSLYTPEEFSLQPKEVNETQLKKLPDDGFLGSHVMSCHVMSCHVMTACCNIGPVTSKNYCPNCGKRIVK